MTLDRVHELLDRFPSVGIAVVGDFFLDKYLVIEESLMEVSLETGLDAYQVVSKRLSPGAAGTVTNNLTALEVGRVWAVGFTGDDGEGYELRQGLERRGVDLTHLILWPELFTPTYIKPMLRDAQGTERELNRLDIKNRQATPQELEDALLDGLQKAVEQSQAVIIADQVEQRDLGVITDRVRQEIAALARGRRDLVFFADSRANIGLFRDVMIKPNRLEAARACGYTGPAEHLGLDDALRHGAELTARTGCPVFVTAGAEGVVVCDGEKSVHVPGIAVPPPVDIVGAGDSTTAGIVSALCAGASLVEAAVIGICVASLTIQQIGTTGTASRQEVARRFAEVREQFSALG